MPLWEQAPTVDQLNALCAGTIHDALGIRFTGVGEDFLEAEMPVEARTRQPFGLLHGGASVVLAESLGSVASGLIAQSESRQCVGIEINANHVRGARDGVVTGRARAVHIGAKLHIWEIRITDSRNRLVCVSRLTVMVREKRPPGAPAPTT